MIFRKVLVAVLFAAVVTGGASAKAKDILAVLPFTGVSADEGNAIADLFSINKELKAVFDIIPRTTITRAIKKEQEFQKYSGMTDPDTIAAIGKQFGARYVVAGNITKLGDRNLLIISILKIDDLRQIAGDIRIYVKIEEIQSKLPGMARNIVKAARIDASKLDKLAVVPVELIGNVDTRIADTLAQILSINLIKSRKYAIYPRTATLEQVQAEYDIQMSGITADDSIVDMGKGENPRFVLSVKAQRVGIQNMFIASIINMESGVEPTGEFENYESLDDAMETMESLARKLVGAPAPKGGASSTSSTTGAGELDRIRTEAEAAAAGAKKADAKSKRERQAGGGVFEYGVLNLALGLGSFIQGDPVGGFFTLLSYGAAAGLIAWELSLGDYDHELAGIPGTMGIGVAGFAIVYGFIRPAVVNHNRALAEIIDRVEIGVAPRIDGQEAVRLMYTVKF